MPAWARGAGKRANPKASAKATAVSMLIWRNFSKILASLLAVRREPTGRPDGGLDPLRPASHE